MGDRTERNRRTAPARNLYNARTYDSITFRVRQDGGDGISRDQIKAAAQQAGQSVNAWIIEAIRDNQAVYLMAVGGAAYLVSKAITAAEVVAFPELGMEAVYEFEVKDMPVTVAVDARGESVHLTGPQIWKGRIEEKAVEVT